MSLTTRPVVARMSGRVVWSEIVNNSVISIIICALLLASQFTVIFAINAVAEGGEYKSTD